ncbi:MAG: cytochrome P450 [bacterium]|nr:cytochrome P450 [bacterium]
MTLPPFHPFSLEYTANPKPYFAHFHADGRLFEHEAFGAWFAHDYESVRAFCDHPQMSRRPSVEHVSEEEAEARLARWPILEARMTGGSAPQDEEYNDQLVLRKVLAPDFRPGTIRKMAATVRDVVAKHLAPIQSEEKVDVVKLVQSVPLSIITQLLGISESGPNAETFLTAGPDFFRGIGPLVSDAAKDRAEAAALAMIQVLAEEVESRRVQPRDDLISNVIEVVDETEGMDPDEVIPTLVVLLAAGTDTTRLTTSLAVKTLLDHPEEMEKLRANRDLLPNAIMELMRFEGATKFLARSTLEDVTWKGQTIPADTSVLISILGAGWDPSVYESPERFDITRELRGTLAFGHGRGFCMGSHLAKLQLEELLGFFLDHLPVGASVDPAEMVWDPSNAFLREIQSMPARLR